MGVFVLQKNQQMVPSIPIGRIKKVEDAVAAIGSGGFSDFSISRTGSQITGVTVGDTDYTISYSGSKVSTINDGSQTLTLAYSGADITGGTVS